MLDNKYGGTKLPMNIVEKYINDILKLFGLKDAKIKNNKSNIILENITIFNCDFRFVFNIIYNNNTTYVDSINLIMVKTQIFDDNQTKSTKKQYNFEINEPISINNEIKLGQKIAKILTPILSKEMSECQPESLSTNPIFTSRKINNKILPSYSNEAMLYHSQEYEKLLEKIAPFENAKIIKSLVKYINKNIEDYFEIKDVKINYYSDYSKAIITLEDNIKIIIIVQNIMSYNECSVEIFKNLKTLFKNTTRMTPTMYNESDIEAISKEIKKALLTL